MSQPRTFEFIPIWNIPVALSYTMRRGKCPACGIKVATVPWAHGKHACCDVFRLFLARWDRRLSWKETASCFHTSWDTVCRAVKWIVDSGLKHRNLEDITAIGVDEVRRTEVKQLKSDGFDPILSTSRYCCLKRPENITARQHTKLKDLLKFDLRSVRAYLLKESCDGFWQYNSPYWARWFLKKWCTRALRSKLDPMQKFVTTLTTHEDLLMNSMQVGSSRV